MTNIRITMEMTEDCPIQMAYCICKHYLQVNHGDAQMTNIDLEEVANHILAFVQAEEKALIIGYKVGEPND